MLCSLYHGTRFVCLAEMFLFPVDIQPHSLLSYVFLEWKENPYEKVPKWKFFLIWGLLLAMPISRMIQGAHYLSDTAVGFMITYTMYLVYRYWFRKRGYL